MADPGRLARGDRRLRAPLERIGIWFVGVLVAYFVVVTLVITRERALLIELVHKLEDVHKKEETLGRLNILVSHAVNDLNISYVSRSIPDSQNILLLDVEAVLGELEALQTSYAGLGFDMSALRDSSERLQQVPSRALIGELRATFHRLVSDLDVVTTDVRDEKLRVLDLYRKTHDRLTIEWFLFVSAGIVALGVVAFVFFHRLARDINVASARATDIVRGYRGDPLPQVRHDELGALMDAVNGMQEELRSRETQLEISRQQHFHKEKMAAVGSLAAAVAHEVNNPLSAIVGVAQAMLDESRHRQCANGGAACQPALILDQARRVMQITRQIGEFSVPQSLEPALTDINALVRSTCNFVGYDRRFRRIELQHVLDGNLPAVEVVADHTVQVLINLLINAADSMEGRTDPKPKVVISTALQRGKVAISVQDNGCGIPPENLEKVFGINYTTKALGRGSGLGLALCRSLVEQSGGKITLQSTSGEGTQACIEFPLPDDVLRL